ncbi:hypothetical protein FHL15_002028 [Xylaria flabelliformis]|uniref:N-acetyltransferase domain-containing protein n=1 Tax=Xylaria flabelliformis TaxID=2512241 RepID=A0A553IAL6_9PEZI|nr:hypothetical protein FHL15_002028 [Xylaria flabelliformis]
MTAKNPPAGYILVEGYPSVEDYLHLRKSCLSPKNVQQAGAALKGSWYGAYVAEETAPTKAIAMGRLVGDGGWYFVLADMMTLPEHQRKGLGDVILKKLLARVKSHAAEGKAHVLLSADPPGVKLYQNNGFRIMGPQETGMGLFIDVEQE